MQCSCDSLNRILRYQSSHLLWNYCHAVTVRYRTSAPVAVTIAARHPCRLPLRDWPFRPRHYRGVPRTRGACSHRHTDWWPRPGSPIPASRQPTPAGRWPWAVGGTPPIDAGCAPGPLGWQTAPVAAAAVVAMAGRPTRRYVPRGQVTGHSGTGSGQDEVKR